MSLWLIDDEGRAHCLSDSFTASFYVHGPTAELHDLCVMIRSARLPVELRRAVRYDLFERRELELLEIAVADPARFPALVYTVKRFKPALKFYNCTVPLAQLYFYARDLYPLARVEIETDESKRVRSIERHDSRWDIDYDLPPLNVMTMRMEDEEGNPSHGSRPRPIEIRCEGLAHILQDDDPREFLERIQGLLKRYDPDLILSAYGDSFIFPRLLEMSRRYGVPLAFNRDPSQQIKFKAARTYFSYGQMVFRPSSHTLFGRLHLDVKSAVLFNDYDFDGLFEMARLAQMSIQRVARTSTGTCLTSMEMSTAVREHILIPAVKREAEMFQSADQLPLADRGGLVYQPILGLHEQVAELDFASMFPNIMSKFNVSAETLNCDCCDDARVPELDLRICHQRRGLVSATLAPIVDKRLRLKKRIKELPPSPPRDRYKHLSSCGKWLGVVSFGYMGHANAIYGNITAHQAICAFARDKLLIAKELAEARGFRMLHAIIDAIYVQKKNARADEYPELVSAISQATGLQIDLEGIYNWVAFLPSRQDPLMPVANRYFGTFQDGETKIRGIESRRGDTCAFIRDAQLEMIRVLSNAKNRAEFKTRAAEVMELTCGYLDQLRSGQVPLEELAISLRLSREPSEYKTNTLNAIVAKKLAASGVELTPGERIEYVILENDAAVPNDRACAVEHLDGTQGYDADRYGELLLRAVESLLTPAGITGEMLGEWIKKELPTPALHARLKELQERVYWGPLFEFAEREARMKVRVAA